MSRGTRPQTPRSGAPPGRRPWGEGQKVHDQATGLLQSLGQPSCASHADPSTVQSHSFRQRKVILITYQLNGS